MKLTQKTFALAMIIKLYDFNKPSLYEISITILADCIIMYKTMRLNDFSAATFEFRNPHQNDIE